MAAKSHPQKLSEAFEFNRNNDRKMSDFMQGFIIGALSSMISILFGFLLGKNANKIRVNGGLKMKGPDFRLKNGH